jgi:hypothetical protein
MSPAPGAFGAAPSIEDDTTTFLPTCWAYPSQTLKNFTRKRFTELNHSLRRMSKVPIHSRTLTADDATATPCNGDTLQGF